MTAQLTLFASTFVTATVLCVIGLCIREGSWWSKWVCGTAGVATLSLLIQGLVLICG